MPRNAEQAITGYHAHIYYNARSRETAAVLREQLDETFNVILGRWRDEPVGPHPTSMYQIAFEPAEFSKIVPWLMINRQGLDILVHPESGNDLEDHGDNAIWLGEKLPLKLEMFTMA